MSAGFDPYYKLLGIPPAEQPPDYYRLLGLSRRYEDDVEVIENCSNRVMQSLRQHQAGPHGPEIAKLLNEVSTARRTLLNPEKKRAYDEELRAEELEAAAPPGVTFHVEDDAQLRSPRRSRLKLTLIIVVSLLLGGTATFLIFSNANKPDAVALIPEPAAVDGSKAENAEVKNASLENSTSTPPAAPPQSDSVSETTTKIAGNPQISEKEKSVIRIRKPALDLPLTGRGQETENLLTLVDPTKDGSVGQWAKDVTGLFTQSKDASILVLPFDPVPTCMTFLLGIERLDEAPGEVFIQVPTPTKPAVYGIDAGSPQRFGVFIDANDLTKSPHSQPVAVFQTKTRLNIKLHHDGASLRVEPFPPGSGKEDVFQWSGDFRRLTRGPAELPNIPKRVVILMRGARFKIHSMTIQSVDEAELPSPPSTIKGSALTSLIHQDRDAQRGDWGTSNNPLVAPASPFARLQLPIVVPPEYDLSVSVQIPNDQSEIVLGLPTTEHVVRCYISPRRTDLVGWGQQDLPESSFPAGKPVQFDFQVRKDSISILSAGKLLRRQELTSSRPVEPDQFDIPWLSAEERRRIFFGSNGTTYEILGIGLAANSEAQLASTITPVRSSTGFKRPEGSLIDSDGGSTLGGVAKNPEPSAADLQAALTTIKLQFKADLQKARKPAEKISLAERFKTTAGGESPGSPTRFMLLEQAAELLASAGEPKQALDMIDEVGSSFQCDLLKLKTDLLKTLVKFTKDPDGVRLVLESAFSVAQQAGEAEKYQMATELYGIASALSVRIKLRPVTEAANELKREMLEREEEFAKVEAARKTLVANPNDSDAQLVVGEYACLKRRDWNSGLLALRHCANSDLKGLAERDLANPTGMTERSVLAKDWLAFANSDPQHLRAGYADRAVFWFTRVADESQGLQQQQYRSSIREAVATRDWDQPYVHLLVKLQKAFELRKVDKTALIGTPSSRDISFDELPSVPGVLVGLDLRLRPLTVVSDGERILTEQVDILRGVYLTAAGLVVSDDSINDSRLNSDTEESEDTGKERLIRLRAQRGYALAGLRLEAGSSIYRLAALFRKITPRGLDIDRGYWSEVVGTGTTVGRTKRFLETPDTRGLPIIGITGERTRSGSNRRINQIGFITATPQPN